MNATPFLLAAALTPRDQWHERWKYINRLAGIVSVEMNSRLVPDAGRRAQLEIDQVARQFAKFLRSREDAGVDVAAIRAQERELIDGLTKRVAECLMLGACADIDGVKMTLDAIRRTKERK